MTKNLNRPQATNRLESHHCDLYYDCRFFFASWKSPNLEVTRNTLNKLWAWSQRKKDRVRKSPSSLGSFSHHSFNWRKKNAKLMPFMCQKRWWSRGGGVERCATDQPPPTAAVTLYLKWGVLWTKKNQHFTNKTYPDWGGEAVQYKYDRKFWSSSLNMKWDAWLLTLMSAVRAVFPG